MSARPGAGHRLVWHSVPPWAPTAYGQQSALVARCLRDAGYDVLITADAGLEHGPVRWEGMEVQGAPMGWSNSLTNAIDAHLEPGEGAVITMIDPFRLRQQDLSGRQVISWVPVHGRPLDHGIAEHLHATSSYPVAFSSFGAQQLADAGFDDVPVIPLGVDLDVFGPLVPGDRQASRPEARRQLDLPLDTFVVGVVGANTQPLVNRKCIPEVIMAVSELARAHDDVLLYLHTDIEGSWTNGQDLRLAIRTLASDRVDVRATALAAYRRGLSAQDLALRYNAFDVLCAPSKTEGFCVPMIEAQACGVPVIASNASAQPENVGAGWLVDGQTEWYAPDATTWFHPSIESIRSALEAAHGEGPARWQEAVEFAGGFDHRRLFEEHWLPLLAERGVGPPR